MVMKLSSCQLFVSLVPSLPSLTSTSPHWPFLPLPSFPLSSWFSVHTALATDFWLCSRVEDGMFNVLSIQDYCRRSRTIGSCRRVPSSVWLQDFHQAVRPNHAALSTARLRWVPHTIDRDILLRRSNPLIQTVSKVSTHQFLDDLSESGLLSTNTSQILDVLSEVKVYVMDLGSKYHEDLADVVPKADKSSCIVPRDYGCRSYRKDEGEYTICNTNPFTAERIFHERLSSSRVRKQSTAADHVPV